MRHLIHLHDDNEQGRILGLLEGAGIPCMVKADRVAFEQECDIFVCLDHQYDDARQVLINPAHKVASPVDVKEYERLLEQQSSIPMLLAALVLLAGTVSTIVIWFLVAG
jgi:hypothetical protein